MSAFGCKQCFHFPTLALFLVPMHNNRALQPPIFTGTTAALAARDFLRMRGEILLRRRTSPFSGRALFLIDIMDGVLSDLILLDRHLPVCEASPVHDCLVILHQDSSQKHHFPIVEHRRRIVSPEKACVAAERGEKDITARSAISPSDLSRLSDPNRW